MQNLNPGSNDSVSASEAREILAAWNNRMTAQGVDPSVGSVQGLAAGLGATEEQVRQMLEDIRVHKRSQQIAAGIIDEQQKQRKKSDVNAAFIAAVVVVLMVLIAVPLFFALRGRGAAAAPVTPPPMEIVIPDIPVIPPTPITPRIHVDDGTSIVRADDKGNVISFDESGYHEVNDGTVISLRGEQAIEAVREKIVEQEKRVKDLEAIKSPTEAQKSDLDDARSDLSTYKRGLKFLEKQQATPAPGDSAPG